MPPTSSKGLPKIKQPNVYFASGDSGYVVADTKQLELDYQTGNGTNVESHYKSTGGVQLTSLFKRAAFALRLGDFNLLISDQITDKSRLLFVRDPVQIAEKAAPFLTFNQNPVRRSEHQQTGRSTGSSTGTRPPTSIPTRRTRTPSRWHRAAACPAATTMCAIR